MREIALRFDHGLGDCVQFAHAIQLYKAAGYTVRVEGEANKEFVWRSAGVDFRTQPMGWPRMIYGYPAHFEDLDAPDETTNKVAWNLGREMLPPLGGSPLDQWRRLCRVRLDATGHLSPQATQEAQAFVADLPHPRVCVHTRGTNWDERKSLSTRVAFETICELLGLDCSVIVLDWDARSPLVDHERCRGLRSRWGQIDLERLIALYMACDLLIAVDSGPLHLASLTNLATLGVFRDLQPWRVCLPNPRATYLISAHHLARAETRDPDLWRWAFYPSLEPTASDIVVAAMEKLEGHECAWPMESQAVAGRYAYSRLGHDCRRIELRADGIIGEGAAGAERSWSAVLLDGRPAIRVSGDAGPICTCRMDWDGIYRGRWRRFERMPIELVREQEPDRAAIPPGCDARTRGDGLWWVVDPTVVESDLSLRDHEDWIRQYFPLGPDRVAVDLGAHVGYHAIWLAQRCAHVLAIEPLAEHARLLRANAALNRVTARIEVLEAVVGEDRGYSAAVDPHKGMSVRFVDCTGADAAVDRVQRVSLDELLLSVPRVDVIKVDVEGDEVAVVRGGMDALRRLRPRLLIEVHGHFAGCEANSTLLQDLLRGLGYRCRQVWDNGGRYNYLVADPAESPAS